MANERHDGKHHDGFAVVMEDKASSPRGFWFVGAWLDRATADAICAKHGKGCEVKPFSFAPSATWRCSQCCGTGRIDNHVTGEVECGLCEGSGELPRSTPSSTMADVPLDRQPTHVRQLLKAEAAQSSTRQSVLRGELVRLSGVIEQMVKQYGHPDWSAAEFLEDLTDIAKQLEALSHAAPSATRRMSFLGEIFIKYFDRLNDPVDTDSIPTIVTEMMDEANEAIRRADGTVTP